MRRRGQACFLTLGRGGVLAVRRAPQGEKTRLDRMHRRPQSTAGEKSGLVKSTHGGPGRTKWHLHQRQFLLVAEEGESLQDFGGPRRVRAARFDHRQRDTVNRIHYDRRPLRPTDPHDLARIRIQSATEDELLLLA